MKSRKNLPSKQSRHQLQEEKRKGEVREGERVRAQNSDLGDREVDQEIVHPSETRPAVGRRTTITITDNIEEEVNSCLSVSTLYHTH